MTRVSKYALVVEGVRTPLYVVATMDHGGGDQGVISYEAPGSNGGTTITTGRTTEIITLTGKLIELPNLTLSQLRTFWKGVRDAGQAVSLFSPLDDGMSGEYVVQSFQSSLPEGQARYLNFTMTLRELRQANIQKSQINLVNFSPAEEAQKVIEERNLG